MTRNSLLFICIAMMALGLACGTRYEPKPEASTDQVVQAEEGQERTVRLDDVPPPVRDAILAEAGEQEIAEIEEITFADRVVYEADWMVDGGEIEVRISADGTVIGRGTGEDEVEEQPDDADDEENDIDGDDDEAVESR